MAATSIALGGVADAHSPTSSASPPAPVERTGKSIKMLRLGDGVRVPANGRYRTAAQEELFVDAVGEAYALGASDEELLDDFGLVNLDPEATPDEDSVEERLPSRPAQFKADCSAGGVGDNYNGADATGFTVGAPGFYASSFPRSDNYVMARWNWNGNGPNRGVNQCWDDIGNSDGFGITLSRDVTRSYQYLYKCNWSGSCNEGGSMIDNNPRGATFFFQDRANTIGADFESGSLVVGFSYQKPNKCHQAFAKYLHTWNDSAITGFGVGPFSFDIQWNSSDKHWTRAGNAGNNGKC
jgi:hypothetical protein